jgi:acetyltransferase-like isoleucine patch superfamily enzyme
MKNIIEKIIQLRNPKFAFDTSITNSMIIELVIDKAVMIFRSIFYHVVRLKKPGLYFFGKGVSFYNYRNIKLGRWVKLDDHVFLNALGKGKLIIGNNSGIGAFSRIEISQSFNNLGQHITIGNNVGIGPYASLGGAGGLDIGNECIIGPYLSCHPENHNSTDTNISIRLQGVNRRGIIIGPNCWIGAKVTILDGVVIGQGSIIAAGAVVTKSFSENSVIGGVPSKLLKIRTNSTINKNQLT